MSEAATLTITGVPVNVSTTPIELIAGWNWIGYLPNFNLDINDALTSLGEYAFYFKGQVGYSDYYDGYGWLGTIDTFDNLSMYKINLVSSAQYSNQFINMKQ